MGQWVAQLLEAAKLAVQTSTVTPINGIQGWMQLKAANPIVSGDPADISWIYYMYRAQIAQDLQQSVHLLSKGLTGIIADCAQWLSGGDGAKIPLREPIWRRLKEEHRRKICVAPCTQQSGASKTTMRLENRPSWLQFNRHAAQKFIKDLFCEEHLCGHDPRWFLDHASCLLCSKQGALWWRKLWEHIFWRCELFRGIANEHGLGWLVYLC